MQEPWATAEPSRAHRESGSDCPKQGNRGCPDPDVVGCRPAPHRTPNSNSRSRRQGCSSWLCAWTTLQPSSAKKQAARETSQSTRCHSSSGQRGSGLHDSLQEDPLTFLRIRSFLAGYAEQDGVYGRGSAPKPLSRIRITRSVRSGPASRALPTPRGADSELRKAGGGAGSARMPPRTARGRLHDLASSRPISTGWDPRPCPEQPVTNQAARVSPRQSEGTLPWHERVGTPSGVCTVIIIPRTGYANVRTG